MIELNYDKDNSFRFLSFHENTHTIVPVMTTKTAFSIKDKPDVLPMPGNEKPVRLTETFLENKNLCIHEFIPFVLYHNEIIVQKNAKSLYECQAFQNGLLDKNAMQKALQDIFEVACTWDLEESETEKRKCKQFHIKVYYEKNEDLTKKIRALYNMYLFNNHIYDILQEKKPIPRMWNRWLNAYEKNYFGKMIPVQQKLNDMAKQALFLFPDAQPERLSAASKIVTKIGRPLWDTNGTDKSFVYIRVPVSLVSESHRSVLSKNDVVYQYHKELGMFAVAKIVSEVRWKNTGLPAGSLKLSHAAITAQSELICTFEIKEELL